MIEPLRILLSSDSVRNAGIGRKLKAEKAWSEVEAVAMTLCREEI
jgi:hypothetical protein